MKRPEILQGTTTVIETGSGRVHVTLNHNEGSPYEVFVMLGKSGSEERALTEGLSRLLSTSLQHGVPLEQLGKQLRGISSEMAYGFGPSKVLSVADAVGRVLIKQKEGVQNDEQADSGDEKVTGMGGEGDQVVGRAVPLAGSGVRAA